MSTRLSCFARRRPLRCLATDARRAAPYGARPPRAPPEVRRRALPCGGWATSVVGQADLIGETLWRETRAAEPCAQSRLAVVVAASDTALRAVLRIRVLRHGWRVVGCVDARAFPANCGDSALVVAAECGEGLQVFTFDSADGALPDLGRARLAHALGCETTPSWVAFAGERAFEVDEDGLRDDSAALRAFCRRIDGLFPNSQASGVVVRASLTRSDATALSAEKRDANAAAVAAPGRLVHALRRMPLKDGQRAKRADRLKVLSSQQGAVVGLAVLVRDDHPRNDASSTAATSADAAASCAAIAELAFGGVGARRLWCAGDGASGSDDQRALSTLMRFYEALDSRDAEAMAQLWLDEASSDPDSAVSVAHAGRPLVSGYEAVVASWTELLRKDPRKYRGDRPFGILLDDIRLTARGELGYATSVQRIGDEGPIVHATNTFAKVAGRYHLTHYHASHQLVDH